MAQPAAAGMASASAASPAQPAISTSPSTAKNGAKTQAHPPVQAPSSISQDKSQNVAASAAQPPPASTETSAASAEAKASGQHAEATANSNGDASAMDCALRTQEDARRLQFALAQQQVEQYQAMTKQLEAQSGIAMTPSSTIGSSNSTITTSMTGLAKTSEDLQKLRQEQLTRLQQNVQRQAAMAAQAVQKRDNEEWLRSKLLLEQEHLRLLRLHEQQLKQTKGNTVTAATATSIADGLLAQQQQVMRQQQLLRDMMQKQQKQQQAQLQLQIQLQKGEKSTTSSTTQAVTTTTKPYVTTAPTYYSLKKKKSKTAFDTDLEALAKVCIRVANSRTDCEMRQALDKITSWLHRCTELMLLQIAQRDYRDSLAHRRPVLIQQDRWPLDLQVKSEFVTQKIVQMLGAFALREKNKAAQQEAAAKAAAAASSAVATASAATTSVGAANATATVPATSNVTSTTPANGTTGSAGNTAAASTPASATATTPTAPAATASQSIILSPAVRVPVKRDMAAVEREYAEIKAQLQAKQLETNQKAKAKRDAAKLEAAKVSNSTTTAAMLAASYKRPLQVEIPGSVKKPRMDSIGTPSPSISTGYRPSTTTVPPISPRVAQQFYDLDLATRASSESDDKMYLPSKIISKIMYRALPGDHEENTATTESVKGRTPSPAVSPTHSVQELDSSQDSISISDDAVTFMQECVTEFLLYFTSESRDLSIMQNRRTKKGVGLSISGSNVVESMENLGFTSYARVLSGYNEKVKASQDAAARKKMERKKLVQQQALQKAIAANAAKAGKSVIPPQPYTNIGIKPVVPSPLARPGASVASTITRVIPSAKPTTAPNPVAVATTKATPPVAKPEIPATTCSTTPTK
ncbi:hypothetical protein F442_07522 [Phytophthora nicotianae P10297]|uniref:Transcription factor CBF/NF-Y/archaeal histone domain-containing protein n=1 Tax=Phytophthora nicotianae P10297 TaxID=1317064 RepID=W2ZFY9_PHYNI|nr:hypothetical protein F442_07522 [Phytophthora nicotianae P10297]